MPTYNKLVRDKIPQVLEAKGLAFRTRILDETEYRAELQTKLKEEMNELLNATSSEETLEELADILEVVHALTQINGSTTTELEALRAKKADKRGGFQERVYLIDVEDN
ncbi:nucleoside triphosphate pyrophosphohydrolase [Paenibacillus soyae]|uniref:Nucleoside triphosphate pyrophosphohydrolase n=1 Tax=Paenibacillus soyae TaxID=2969249 RepID=A0A9X2ML65_9BACL|nr:nucleoside triphosphate pyrophosphohydrolase [Paenibacillus soyae]MCR2803998.1 nucleoside triphosphate pyrophosphohydrolase [Paenibacillus soyae]